MRNNTKRLEDRSTNFGRQAKIKIGDLVDGDLHPSGHRQAMNGFFYRGQFISKVSVDVQDDRLIEIALFAPVVIKG